MEHQKEMNAAYEVGVQFALFAAKETLKLGDVRMQRVLDRLTDLEVSKGIKIEGTRKGLDLEE